MVALVGYALSFGPAAWLTTKIAADWADNLYAIVYRPIIDFDVRAPRAIGRTFANDVQWWTGMLVETAPLILPLSLSAEFPAGVD